MDIDAGPGGALSTGAAEAGLRWLTDRWPGGTIGNEAEVYSGYYTEAASVRNLIIPARRASGTPDPEPR